MTKVTPTRTAKSGITTTFGRGDWRYLCALRDQYQQTRDLFSAREMAALHFVRWLYRTGRVML